MCEAVPILITGHRYRQDPLWVALEVTILVELKGLQ
jgi:hypothetical protein